MKHRGHPGYSVARNKDGSLVEPLSIRSVKVRGDLPMADLTLPVAEFLCGSVNDAYQDGHDDGRAAGLLEGRYRALEQIRVALGIEEEKDPHGPVPRV